VKTTKSKHTKREKSGEGCKCIKPTSCDDVSKTGSGFTKSTNYLII